MALERILQEKPNGQKVLTIPSDLANMLGWEKGDIIKFVSKEESTITLKKD